MHRIAPFGGDGDGAEREAFMVVLCMSGEVEERATITAGDGKPIPFF
ncbi:MAG: hypothetical protein ACO288_02310 [Ilumatobacteraceae bacterium]